jgi:OmpA-OmpF porin, OOP family
MRKSGTYLSLLIVCGMLSMNSSLSAQNSTNVDEIVPTHGWYVGIEGGLPFGLSTFSSFGHDKTHLGWTAGLYGGYKFNPVLSAELSAKYGQMTLSACDCCVERDYWLGIDGVRYNASVLNMEGWNYSDLQSKVSIGQYGARLNVNVLGLFNKTKNSRWSVSLSPHVYAISTKTNIQIIANGSDKMRGDMKWHFGYGGDLQEACHINRHLQLGIYSGITALTGSKMDDVPEYLHKNNFVWEIGLRIGFHFGKAKKAVKETPVNSIVVCPEETEAPTIAERTPVTVTPTVNAKEIVFPDIYFNFNQTTIPASEETKLKEILAVMKKHPEMKVTVKGWCDTNGGTEVNKRYSEARALAVKNWLINRGISAERIETIGMGSDFNEPDAAKARRASTEEQKK